MSQLAAVWGRRDEPLRPRGAQIAKEGSQCHDKNRSILFSLHTYILKPNLRIRPIILRSNVAYLRTRLPKTVNMQTSNRPIKNTAGNIAVGHVVNWTKGRPGVIPLSHPGPLPPAVRSRAVGGVRITVRPVPRTALRRQLAQTLVRQKQSRHIKEANTQ